MMKPSIALCVFACLPVCGFGLSAPAPVPANTQDEEAAAPATRMLRMRSGAILFGTIVDHTSEALRFRRLDTGGVVRLPWSLLDAEEEKDLRLRLGYAEVATEELRTVAERILLAAGGEVVGVIVNRTEEHLWIKNRGGVVPVSKSAITGAATRITVPALDIYSKEELYQNKNAELRDSLLQPGLAGAVAHAEIARYSERLFDYAHAVEHYGHVQNLAPEFEAREIAQALDRARDKAAQQEELDFLSEIETQRARKRFDLALAGLELFAERYPETPLHEDWLKLRERVLKYQERAVNEQVVRLFHSWTVRLARSAVRKQIPYEGLVAYLEDGMLEELLGGVQGDLEELAPKIELDEIRRRWHARDGGRFHQASFGLGTWLLGEERALAKYEEEAQPKSQPKKGSQAAARKQLEDRIQRYLRNQELTRKARSGSAAAVDDDPGGFWKAWNYAGRYQWALAYFAEFSSLFKIERVVLSVCRECGGKGVREVLDLGSARQGARRSSKLYPCKSCRTLGHVRRIKYR